MKDTRSLMGMHVTVEIADPRAAKSDLDQVYAYFQHVDEKFSPFKTTSEVSAINDHLISPADYSPEMLEVLKLCETTSQETHGYFDIHHEGRINPSGLVKGWAIKNAADILLSSGFTDFYVDAGGDIQVYGHNSHQEPWSIGIKNPFNLAQIVKIIYPPGPSLGIATSGTYERGRHIYNPHSSADQLSDIVSLTVIGPNIYEADRFATAAFAMGRSGIDFINTLPGFAGYMIDKDGQAVFTSEFNRYTSKV